MFVLTIDQRASRRRGDQVDGLLDWLGVCERAGGFVRSFERTAGDEVQGVLQDAATVVDLALGIVRWRWWSVGIGVGPVDEPLPASARAGSGRAFEYARDAVTRAKSRPDHVAVTGAGSDHASDAEAVFGLLGATVQRRTDQGWEVVDLLATGLSQKEAADKLGVSPQAVSQRLAATLWHQERRARPLVAKLLTWADA